MAVGCVTGVGHARLINERFGRGWGWFSLGNLFLLNFLTIVTEFIGITLATDYISISRYVVVPTAAVALIAIMATASFRRWERAPEPLAHAIAGVDRGHLADAVRPALRTLRGNAFQQLRIGIPQHPLSTSQLGADVEPDKPEDDEQEQHLTGVAPGGPMLNPSARVLDTCERMRLVRDDIAAHATDLYTRLQAHSL